MNRANPWSKLTSGCNFFAKYSNDFTNKQKSIFIGVLLVLIDRDFGSKTVL